MQKKSKIADNDKMIGSRIKELKIRKSLTQKQLADAVMVSARLETGESMVSVYTIIRIAETLDDSTSAILMEDVSSENVREDLRALT